MAPAAGAQRGIAPTQTLALLTTTHAARAAPTLAARLIGRVSPERPLTRERTALPVIGQSTGKKGARWLHVLLPGRPNGHSGWIEQRGTTVAFTHWHLVVSTGRRIVKVYWEGRVVRTFAAVVGKPSTPTPPGRFFVEESIALRSADVGAPVALALSARSNVLQEFDGGPGQIALHGLANVGGTPGTAVSHGCVRLPDAVMRWLATRIGPGTPVTITG
jgi:hypothetical protein